MDVKKITLLFAILICAFSCSDSHTEPDENENPDDTTTIYDLFPDYNLYDNLYHVVGCIMMENISTGERKNFPIEEAGLLIKITVPEWKIPNNTPYLANTYFGAIRLIMPNEVCYKKAFEIFPDYFYYECLLSVKKIYELENTETKERQQFEINNAERLLRNPNGEWKIPNNAPYNMNFDNGLTLIRISKMCRAL